MLAASLLLAPAVDTVLSSDAALSNTVIVAGLASALASWVKRTVQFTKEASSLQGRPMPAAAAAAVTDSASEADSTEAEAAACFLAAAPALINHVLMPAAATAAAAAQRTSAAITNTCSSSNSSSNSSSQAAASTAFLATLLARSLLQLADAMQVAGPQLLFDAQQLALSSGLLGHHLGRAM
jgi:hypothetical protein